MRRMDSSRRLCSRDADGVQKGDRKEETDDGSGDFPSEELMARIGQLNNEKMGLIWGVLYAGPPSTKRSVNPVTSPGERDTTADSLSNGSLDQANGKAATSAVL